MNIDEALASLRPKKSESMQSHLTIRADFRLQQAVQDFRKLARKHKLNSSEYLRKVIEKAVKEGSIKIEQYVEQLKQEGISNE